MKKTFDHIPSSFAEADEAMLSVLGDLEGAVNYTSWILELFGNKLTGNILEVGAGQGTYSERLGLMGKLTVLEPSTAQCDVLRGRFTSVCAPEIVCGELSSLAPRNGEFDAVVAINVLEHIKDDGEALSLAFGLLKPGGHLCLWVPSFESLYGPFDRSIGHYRRYRRMSLNGAVETAGFRIVSSRYANLPGWFAWLIVVRLLRRSPTSGALSSFYDRFLVPLIRRVESVLKPPFGQSICLIAEK
jgi:SAM-dependent methyltransferase